jgi:hypothetical protein
LLESDAKFDAMKDFYFEKVRGRTMTEHEIHHRGQIYLYLSMLGIKTPPLYGLTSEEVLERSKTGLQD